MSYRQIAEADGTASEVTVWRSTVSNETVAQPDHVLGKDGKKRAATKPRRSTYQVCQMGHLTRRRAHMARVQHRCEQ